MKSAARGKTTSAVEVTNVSGHGFWLFLDDRERFLSFVEFPWFRDATIAALCKVERPRPGHLYWPDLDIELATESIEAPEKFPLVSRVPVKQRTRTNKRMHPTRATASAGSGRRTARG